jgi:hypothetical protein
VQALKGRVANQRLLAPLLFSLILAAALAAGVIALSSRGADLELYARVTRVFAPTGDGGVPRVATLRVTVGESDPTARVEIVDEDDDHVRTLAAPIALVEGDQRTFHWQGRTDSGTLAPRASYRLRVVLPNRDREMIWPRRIELHR